MRRSPLRLIVVAVSLLGFASTATASVIPITAGVFGPGTTLTTFTGQVNGAEVNGLTVDGILFNYSLGNGLVILDGGPGTTNNVNPLNVVSIGNNTGVMSLSLPTYSGLFGFGFAILAGGVVPDGVTVSVFDNATLLGSLVYVASPDPGFPGGFAGIASTVPFNRVELVFNSTVASAFAFDNIRTGPLEASVPEPATVLLLAAGLGAIAARRVWTKRT